MAVSYTHLMADFYENKQVTEEVILVGVALGETSVTDESLDELEELAKTAGAVTVGRLIQNREMIHPGTYLGKGKLCLLYTSLCLMAA